jgi:hypothetical protein
MYADADAAIGVSSPPPSLPYPTHTPTIEMEPPLSLYLSIFQVGPGSGRPEKIWFFRVEKIPHMTVSLDTAGLNFRVGPRLGRCWGKWSSEAFTTSGRAVGFGSRAASAKRGKLCNGDLTETLMLLKLCEFLLCRNSPTEQCWPSVPKACTVNFRRRRYGGTRSATRRVRLDSGMEAAWARCPERPDVTRARSRAVSAPKVRCAAIRGCGKRVKGGTVRGRDKGRCV